jgi:hypothetical protein
MKLKAMLKETIRFIYELAFFVLISTPLAIMVYSIATLLSYLKTIIKWLKRQPLENR